MASLNTSGPCPTSSNSSSPSPSCHSADTASNIALSVLFLLVFPCALLLNGIAFWISFQLKSKSKFIVYLKNLVASDLIMTLTFPLMSAGLQPGITVELRAFTCRYSDVIFYCSMYTSIALMGLISLDRFLKIVKPCGTSLVRSIVLSQVSSSFIWLLLFGGTGIPTMVLTNQPVPASLSQDFCLELKSPAGVILHGYVIAIMEALFWFICALIVFCYIFITVKVLHSFKNSGSKNNQGKKKTKLRVFSVLLVFFVCFVPLHIIRIPITLEEVYQPSACTHVWLEVLHNLTRWLSTTNACLDPLIYIFLCKEYKSKLVEMIKSTGIQLLHKEK